MVLVAGGVAMPGFNPVSKGSDIREILTRLLSQSEVAKGTKSADGSEQDLVNVSGIGKYEGYIDLTNMGASDIVVVKEYVKLKSGGSFIVYATTTYNGVQAEPAIHAVRKLSEYGWRVTLQQTDGVNRDYDYEFLKEAGG